MRKRNWRLWAIAVAILLAVTLVAAAAAAVVVMNPTTPYRAKDTECAIVVHTEATESLPLAREVEPVQEDYHPLYSQEEVDLVAKTIYGEARGCSDAEKRLVAWCICNRVDAGTWGDTIEDVVTYPGAFYGYNESWPEDSECVKVAQDVLTEWGDGEEADILEPYATTNGYLYFVGDGKHNWFREEY